jgi:uncharacterized OB-fold protein
VSGQVSASDSLPLWEGFEQGELRLPFCTQCLRPHLPPGPVCPYCLSASLDWRLASGHAILSSWVVERRKFFAAFDPPYIVGEVQLAEGPRMAVQVAFEYLDQLSIGLPGHIEFQLAPNGLALPRFELASAMPQPDSQTTVRPQQSQE